MFYQNTSALAILVADMTQPLLRSSKVCRDHLPPPPAAIDHPPPPSSAITYDQPSSVVRKINKQREKDDEGCDGEGFEHDGDDGMDDDEDGMDHVSKLSIFMAAQSVRTSLGSICLHISKV
ncbi:hypothetical protein R6Q59_005783 [Mikania micrantha]